MIILEKPIPSFSNVLTTATGNMKFGVNKDLNYVGVQKDSDSKKDHQPDAPSSHLDSLDGGSVKKQVMNKSKEVYQPKAPLSHLDNGAKQQEKKRQVVDDNHGHNTQLMALFGVMGVFSYIPSKYVL